MGRLDALSGCVWIFRSVHYQRERDEHGKCKYRHQHIQHGNRVRPLLPDTLPIGRFLSKPPQLHARCTGFKWRKSKHCQQRCRECCFSSRKWAYTLQSWKYIHLQLQWERRRGVDQWCWGCLTFTGSGVSCTSTTCTFTGGGGGGGGGGFSPYPATLSQPISTSFTQENFSGATVQDKTGRMVFTESASSTAFLLSNTALPATPYTIDLAGSINIPSLSGYQNIALFLRDASSGNILYYSVGNRGGSTGVELDNYTSYASYNSTSFYVNATTINGGFYFLRITNDGTNVTYYVSNNGLDYTQVYQQTTGTYITASQAGIAAQSGGVQCVFTVYNYVVSGSILPQFAN